MKTHQGIIFAMSIFALSMWIAAAPTTQPSAAATRPTPPTTRVSSTALGLSFDCPAGFEAGAFAAKSKSQDPRGFFGDAVVLVESSEVRQRRLDLKSIPSGQFATISIHHTQNLSKAVQPTTQSVIGGNTVYRLPGWPGPYGDTVFVYVVPTHGADEITFVAAKNYLDRPGNPSTRYDQVIEHILASLRWQTAPTTRAQAD